VFEEVRVEVGDIIVARVNQEWVAAMLKPDHTELTRLIRKE